MISPRCNDCCYLSCGRVLCQLVIASSQVQFPEDLLVMQAVDKIFNYW